MPRRQCKGLARASPRFRASTWKQRSRLSGACLHNRICRKRIRAGSGCRTRTWITGKSRRSRERAGARSACFNSGARPRPAGRDLEKKRHETASDVYLSWHFTTIARSFRRVRISALSLNLRRAHTHTPTHIRARARARPPARMHACYLRARGAPRIFRRSRLFARPLDSSDSARDSVAEALSRLNFPSGWIGYLQPTIRAMPALLCKARLVGSRKEAANLQRRRNA